MEVKNNTNQVTAYKISGGQDHERLYTVTGSGNVVVDVEGLLRDERMPTLIEKARRIVQIGQERERNK